MGSPYEVSDKFKKVNTSSCDANIDGTYPIVGFVAPGGHLRPERRRACLAKNYEMTVFFGLWFTNWNISVVAFFREFANEMLVIVRPT
jgi:hypothetical protein